MGLRAGRSPCDARGFRAKELLQDTDESAITRSTKRPEFEEIKTDLVLSNGARFTTITRIRNIPRPSVRRCASVLRTKRASESSRSARGAELKIAAGKEVSLYKNNTDFSGHVMVATTIISCVATFRGIALSAAFFLFITRQIFAGAGKMGGKGRCY